MGSKTGLWWDREFRRLWVGQTASQFGAQTSLVTVPLVAITALGVGAEQLGVLRAVQQVPILLLALFVGVVVDRARTRAVMVVADVGRAVALAVVPACYLFHALTIPVLVVVAFWVGVFTVFFDVAYQASLSRMVERGQLTQGNSMLESSTSAAQIAGPAVGGGLVSLLSAPIAIIASCGCFLLSSSAIARIRRPEKVPESGRNRMIRDGFRAVAGNASLRAIGLATACFQFFFAALMTSYLLFLPRTLGLSGAEIGLVFAALGPGALLGSLVSASLPRRFGYGVVLVTASATADGVLLAVAGLHGEGPATVAALVAINLVFGFGAQVVNVVMMAVRQASTPYAFQGRVAATIHFVGLGLTPLGSLLGGFGAGQLGLRMSLMLAGAGMLLSPVCLALVRLDEGPE